LEEKRNENRIGRFAGIFVREFGSSFCALSLSISHKTASREGRAFLVIVSIFPENIPQNLI
jgi:hypothetical protein